MRHIHQCKINITNTYIDSDELPWKKILMITQGAMAKLEPFVSLKD
jgi:hypothetical protein